MKNHYTLDEMIKFLECTFPDTEEDEDILEAIRIRLSTQNNTINWMRGRLELAERIIGELYLMQREYEE